VASSKPRAHKVRGREGGRGLSSPTALPNPSAATLASSDEPPDSPEWAEVSRHVGAAACRSIWLAAVREFHQPSALAHAVEPRRWFVDEAAALEEAASTLRAYLTRPLIRAAARAHVYRAHAGLYASPPKTVDDKLKWKLGPLSTPSDPSDPRAIFDALPGVLDLLVGLEEVVRNQVPKTDGHPKQLRGRRFAQHVARIFHREGLPVAAGTNSPYVLVLQSALCAVGESGGHDLIRTMFEEGSLDPWTSPDQARQKPRKNEQDDNGPGYDLQQAWIKRPGG